MRYVVVFWLTSLLTSAALAQSDGRMLPDSLGPLRLVHAEEPLSLRSLVEAAYGVDGDDGTVGIRLRIAAARPAGDELGRAMVQPFVRDTVLVGYPATVVSRGTHTDDQGWTMTAQAALITVALGDHDLEIAATGYAGDRPVGLADALALLHHLDLDRLEKDPFHLVAGVESPRRPPTPETLPEPQALLDGEVLEVAEVQPVLIGGLAGLRDRLEYPASALADGLEGRVLVQFIVDERGGVLDPVVLRSPSEVLSEAAIQAVRESRFEPARQGGRAVKVRFSLPVSFRLPTDD